MNTTPAKDNTLPLDEVMLAMDVVDTLRHRQDLAVRELDAVSKEKQLIDKLRDIYQQQGIAVPDHILKEGVAALAESRFVYTPPKPGLKRTLAHAYVTRGRWGRMVGSILLAIAVLFAGYQFAYLPLKQASVETARLELAETLPAQMDALYHSIFEETKVQSAVGRAEEMRDRGKIAASEGDRSGAEAAIAALTDLRNTIRADYTLQIVNRENQQSGFWTFPEINTEATNYYIVVEAVDREGNPLELPILNEETGETDVVSTWGVRVPEGIYDSVASDKRDDGIIQRNIVGRKPYGYIEVDYVVPVLGGAVTRW